MKILLDENKKFFKANLHCHSTKSDGKLTVETLKAEYKKRGYSIVAFTDHEHLIDNSYLDDDEFLTITSCEVAIKEFPAISTLKKLDMRVTHLNFYALDQHNVVTPCYASEYDHYGYEGIKDEIRYEGEFERKYSAEGVNEIIKIAKEKGFIVSYNHPTWSLENASHYLNYEGMFAVEIYNHSCSLQGHADDEHVFDDLLRADKAVFCTCADDNHNARPFDGPYCDSFGGFVQINAEKLDYATVMDALQKGNFYASTGAQILSLVKDGDKVHIKTAPSKRIFLLTRGRRCEKVIASENETVTEATFTLWDSDEYFRIRVEDEKGKRAYTQAYPVK